MALVVVLGAGVLVLLAAAFWNVKRYKHSDRRLLPTFWLFLAIVTGVSAAGVLTVYVLALAISLTGHRLYAYLGLGPVIAALAWQYATTRIRREPTRQKASLS
jgi:hypothetical protein